MANYDKQEIDSAKDNFLLKCRQATNQSDNLGDFLEKIELLYIDLIFLIDQVDEELAQEDAIELGKILQEAKDAWEALNTHVKTKFASL